MYYTFVVWYLTSLKKMLTVSNFGFLLLVALRHL